MKKSAVIISIFIIFSIFAAEVDQFSGSQFRLNDSAGIINKKTDQLIDKALADANTKNHCNEKKLYSELRKQLRIKSWGKLVDFVERDPSVDRVRINIRNSIYSDFNVIDSLVLGVVAYTYSKPLGDILRVGDTYVGVDKFEHFLGRGFKYFNAHYLKNKPLAKVVKSLNNERGILGAWTTGVMSYGDLSANFNGMRFWNHILLKKDDYFGSEWNLGPYIICQNDNWVKNKSIDWRNYFDNSMDESINCSKFRNKRQLRKVKNRLDILGQEFGRELNCPLDQNLFDQMMDKYGEYVFWLLNPDGLAVIDQENDLYTF
ncbi:MAG: hypothetical protein KAQ98_08800 [Bacteriovoracaceae bacterium]|nr:hypothetical protein [Bacteriovoracaceae bacterium]